MTRREATSSTPARRAKRCTDGQSALEGTGADGEPDVEVGVGVDHEVEGADGDVVEALSVGAGDGGRRGRRSW